MKNTFLLLFLLFVTSSFSNDLKLIPYPNDVKFSEGALKLSNTIRIVHSSEICSEVDFLEEFLEEKGYRVVARGSATSISFHSIKGMSPEAYSLRISPKGVFIEYSTASGAFYAIQTLKQLIPEKGVDAWIPSLTINDQPAFSWRSFMLDEGRYFKGKEIVKQLLDEMSALKFNKFHWHLTEEVGWRIEIKKYPRLTEVGSRRDSCRFGSLFDPRPHCGYYTQQDIKEIISYAEKRHIEVIPEIDMPGHASAAIAAYPSLGTTQKQLIIGNTFDVLNVSDSSVVRVLKEILDEVIALFPSKIIHIGGDEVNTSYWKESPSVNAYMRNHQIGSYGSLQLSFTNTIAAYLSSKGKRMMGWNEITGDLFSETKEAVESQLDKSAIVHFWEGEVDLLKKSLQRGFQVVNSDRHHTYLDYPYEVTSLSKAYHYNPIPEGVPSSLQANVLGIGCQMWGETVRQVEDLYYKIFPRVAAYAESGWTQDKNKNYERFKRALIPLEKEWRAKGYYTLERPN